MNDERFFAPMCILPNGDYLFLRDKCVFVHPEYGVTHGNVVKFIYEVLNLL